MTIKELDRLAKKIFDECEKDGEPVTMEEAMEMARMEIKAGNVKNYTTSAETKTKKREPKPKKVDEDKKKIIEIIHKALTDNGYGAIISNVDRTIDFDNYTVMLTKHRPKK